MVRISMSTASVEEMSGMGKLFPKTLYRVHQSVLCPYRHLLNAESGFDLGVADDIVFSEFLHAERVEGKVEPTAKFGDAVHQSFWQVPDMCFLSHCLADDCNQFIGRKGVIVSTILPLFKQVQCCS